MVLLEVLGQKELKEQAVKLQKAAASEVLL